MKVIIIDSEKKEIRVEKMGNLLSTLQKVVGGYIELALRFPNEDALYVDEEGLLKNYLVGFEIDGRRFVGNGVITGLKKSQMVNAFSNVGEIRKMVMFYTIVLFQPKLN
jgi:hypothetical protein